MAKKSVEKKMREVLQERTFSPSENAWNKIEVQLGSALVTPKKGYLAYGIAAGFVGILFVSIFYLSQQGAEVIPSQEVVKTTNNDLDVPNTLEIQEPLEEKLNNTGGLVLKEPMQKRTQLSNEVLVQRAVLPELREEKLVEDFVSLEKVDTKIAEVMTQVAILEQTQGAISDATVDSLLRTAQKELLGERMLKASQSVDALALLSDVEDELNQSFRDQLFEKLKDGYIKVRSAIAYRNE